MVPADSSRVSRAPPYLGTTEKQDCIFTYAAVTLSGRPFQTVQLTPSRLLFNQAILWFFTKTPLDYCGPATPDSPCESSGLGFSDFARHSSRNHGCFLFLGVLRWFTSPGSLVHPMDSDARNGCSHPLGFPIRKSPDHSLLAASRSLSQLTTSFFAFLRLGIHTHALSSLTITSTSYTTERYFFTCVLKCPSDIQLSKISIASAIGKPAGLRTADSSARERHPCPSPALMFWWAQVESNHRPHPYQGCALAI